MSNRKGKRTPPVPNYQKSVGELMVTRATEHSLWFDDKWYADNPVGGGKSISINWYRGFEPSERRDPRCRTLVDGARRLVDAIGCPATGKRNKKYAVLKSKAPYVLNLVRWLYRNGYGSFSEITPTAADWYKSDILADGPTPLRSDGASSGEDADEVTVSTLAKHLRVLVDIFDLRSELEAFPELCIGVHPFRGESVNSLAEDLATVSDGWIPRVPEEIYQPLTQAVLDWIDVYGKDVLFAQNEYLRIMERRRHRRGKNYAEFTDAALLGVTFNARGTLAHPWRRPFVPSLGGRIQPALSGDPSRGPTSQLRDLIEDLGAAGSIAVHAMTGVRVSELLGVKAEPRKDDDWPACLSMRQSRSGLYDVFFLLGTVFKGTSDNQGEPAEWILGVRPVGTDVLPIAVRAILCLDSLYRPWRERFGIDYLVVSLGKGGSLPHTPPPNTKPLSDTQRRLQTTFIKRHVVLPAEFENWIVTPHQYRKTFAQDIVRINPKALPAVRDNFKHASEYVTEEAYVGSDTTMLRLMDDVATREAAKMMVERVFGKVPLGGRAADLIDTQEARIRELCRGADTTERRITALQAAISIDGIRLFTSDYLDCLFRPQHAMCHRDLLGRFDPDAKRPLQAYRTRKNCSVCSNGVINGNHVGYWVDRYREHSSIAEANSTAASDRGVAALAAARAGQAKSVLRKIGRWPLDAN